MKRIVLMIVIISSFFVQYGQNHFYYYYKRNPVAVPIHNNDCLLFIDSGTSLDEISNAGLGVEDIFNMSDSSIQCVKISGSSKSEFVLSLQCQSNGRMTLHFFY